MIRTDTDYLSKSLIAILEQIVTSSDICKLIKYTDMKPLNQPSFDGDLLVMKQILPYPFDNKVDNDSKIYLHVYYPTANFEENKIMTAPIVNFDIVVPRTQWLIKQDVGLKSNKLIRPYEIMCRLTSVLDEGRNMPYGRINFQSFIHVQVDDVYDCIRLQAELPNV